MNGLGVTIQKGDNIDTFITRAGIVFLIYYALQHQRELNDISNQLEPIFWIVLSIVVLYFVDAKISAVTDDSLYDFQVFVSIWMTWAQIYLGYLLLALSDSLLSTATTNASFTFTMLSRPIVLMTLMAGILTLVRKFYHKRNP